ncbi:hypothetical protein M0802_008750 [Mischocyttarus mexicanus]|nr:hypothetical protein M0802_008750 [Mischocyttarus mexicanus]
MGNNELTLQSLRSFSTLTTQRQRSMSEPTVNFFFSIFDETTIAAIAAAAVVAAAVAAAAVAAGPSSRSSFQSRSRYGPVKFKWHALNELPGLETKIRL